MNNLTPEVRPDKNGNFVTRWVRGVFNKTAQDKEIPRVSVKQGSRLSKIQAEEIYNRLIEGLPKGSDSELIARGEISALTDRRAINEAYSDKDWKLLSLMDKLSPDSRPFTLTRASRLLNEYGVDSNTLDTIKVDAYEVLNNLLLESHVKAVGPKEFSKTTIHLMDQPLLFHILEHPEELPLAVEIVKRGYYDQNEIMLELKERKQDDIKSAINDGFL